MGFGKRGLSKASISIIVILVVLVAVVLVYNFAVKKAQEQPSPVSEQCAYFCETNQSGAFCTFKVSASDSLRVTCNELLTNSQYSGYGVQACSTISCTSQPQGNSQVASDQTCSGLDGTWKTPSSGNCPVKDGFFSRVRTAEDSPPATGQICCYYYQ